MASAAVKVVMIVPQLDPVSGMESAAIRLVAALYPKWDIEIVALSGGAAADFELPGCRVRFLRLPGGARRFALAALRLRRELRSIPADSVIVAVGVWAALPTLWASPKAPVIVWEHSLLPARMNHDPRMRVLARIAAHTYKKSAGIVAVSEAVREFVSRLAGASVVVIPNLIGSEDHRHAVESHSRGDANRVVIVGNLNRLKNVSLALQAIAHLPESVSLRIVGDGPERAALSRESHSLGLDSRVEFVGHVRDVRPFFASAAVVAHPSWVETFGYSLLEASQHSRPVIALDRPNMNNLIPEFVPGILVSEATPVGYARAIADALSRDWPEDIFERARVARAALLNRATIQASWEALFRTCGS